MMFCEFHLCEHFLPITGLFAGTFSARFISGGLFMVTVIVRTFSRRLTQKDSQKWSRILSRKWQERNVLLKLENIISQVIFSRLKEPAICKVIEGHFFLFVKSCPMELTVFLCMSIHHSKRFKVFYHKSYQVHTYNLQCLLGLFGNLYLPNKLLRNQLGLMEHSNNIVLVLCNESAVNETWNVFYLIEF